jgi:hypothetical protein
MSYPYITVKLKTDKIGTINVKKTDGNDFKIIDELNNEIKDVELIKKDTEEKIKSIVIEKKEVTENDLEKLDQDSDGKITIKDAEIVKSKTDKDSEVIDSQTKVCKAGEYL